MRYFIILLFLISPAFAADYTLGNPPAGAVLGDNTIDKACTVRCLKAGGNQSMCDKICDEAVESNLPSDVKNTINSAVGGFADVDFSCFKKCRNEGENFAECKTLCRP